MSSIASDRASASLSGNNLTITLENKVYGIAISQVRKLIREEKVFLCPEMPDFVKSMLSLLGHESLTVARRLVCARRIFAGENQRDPSATTKIMTFLNTQFIALLSLLVFGSVSVQSVDAQSEAATIQWLQEHLSIFNSDGQKGSQTTHTWIDKIQLIDDKLVVVIQCEYLAKDINTANQASLQLYTTAKFPLSSISIPVSKITKEGTPQANSITLVSVNVKDSRFVEYASLTTNLTLNSFSCTDQEGRHPDYLDLTQPTDKRWLYLSSHLSKSPSSLLTFGFNDPELASRFSKAITHLAELHGAKPDDLFK